MSEAVRKFGISPPVVSLLDLSHIGEEVQAGTIVQGDLLDYRFRAGRAQIAMRIVAYDVRTMLPVNGARLRGDAIASVEDGDRPREHRA